VLDLLSTTFYSLTQTPLYSPLTRVRATVAAETVVVSEDRARQ